MGVAERREREREGRRQRILDAAERVFSERGALQATVDEVAQAAELSKGTLYLYFESKDAIYMGLVVRSLSELIARVEALPAAATGLLGLERMLLCQRELVLEQPHQFRTLLAWLASGFRADPASSMFQAYRELSRRMFRHVVALIEAGQRDGSMRPVRDVPTTVLTLWGASTGVWMMYFSQPELERRLPQPVDFEGLFTGFAELVLQALRAEPAGATTGPAPLCERSEHAEPVERSEHA